MDINSLLAILTMGSAFSVFAYLFFCARKDPSLAGASLPSREAMKPHFVLFAFYSNPDDPRGWVPQLWGFGWTVNFRKKRQIAVFAGLLLMTIASALTQASFAFSMLLQ